MITGTALAEFGTGDIQTGITVSEGGTGISGYRNKEEEPTGELNGGDKRDGSMHTGGRYQPLPILCPGMLWLQCTT